MLKLMDNTTGFFLTFKIDVGGKDPTRRGAPGTEVGNEDGPSALSKLITEHIIKKKSI